MPRNCLTVWFFVFSFVSGSSNNIIKNFEKTSFQMSKKSTIPPFPNVLNYDSRELGSLDPFAIRKQLHTRSSARNHYFEIGQLSLRAEELRKENDIMRQELYDLVTADNASQICRLKKSFLEFELRLADREKEVDEIKKYLVTAGQYQPTFVEVDIHRDRHASFDLVATSLLVSNQQRTFFKASDIRRQNEELLALIEHQQEALRMVNARLQLYSSYQSQNSIRIKIDTLKRGFNPPLLTDSTPNQIKEQQMKIKMLSKELKQLVNQRKQLTAGRNNKRLKARLNKRKNRLAIKIQKVFRGYLVRKEMQNLHLAATKIQRIFRWYLVKRDHTKPKKSTPKPAPVQVEEPKVEAPIESTIEEQGNVEVTPESVEEPEPQSEEQNQEPQEEEQVEQIEESQPTEQIEQTEDKEPELEPSEPEAPEPAQEPPKSNKVDTESNTESIMTLEHLE